MNKIVCNMLSPESHKRAYPVSHDLWEDVKDLTFTDAQIEGAQFMFDAVGVYEHGEADMIKGITLRKYAAVVKDMMIGLAYVNVGGEEASR